MITLAELTAKLWSYPEARRLFDQMADRPLPDAAYFLLRRGYWFNDIQFRAGLVSPPFIDDSSAEPIPQTYVDAPRLTVDIDLHELMLARLAAAHPEATAKGLLDAVAAARRLEEAERSVLRGLHDDLTGFRFVARLQENCPGFEQKTYELVYHDFQVRNR